MISKIDGVWTAAYPPFPLRAPRLTGFFASEFSPLSGVKHSFPSCVSTLSQCKFNEHSVAVTLMRSISKNVALLCLVLTCCSAFLYAAHHHSNLTDEAKCTVCVASHSASPRTTHTLTSCALVVVSTFRPASVSAKERLIAFALCVRPPPSV